MEQEQERDNSVYDFLYVDRNKLSYALAQLSDDGVVQVTKRISAITGANGGSLKAGAALVGGSVTATDGFSESSDMQFDASWLLPTNAIHVLNDHGYIKRTLHAEIGTIVLLKGALSIFDIDLIKRVWDGMSSFLLGREEGTKKQLAQQKSEYMFVGKILKDLPPLIQFSLETEEGEAWSLLNEQSLALSQHEIAFKHGHSIQGEWHVLGILDAFPGPAPLPSLSGDRMLHHLAPVTNQFRSFMGRPDEAYGITPLLIFRECK